MFTISPRVYTYHLNNLLSSILMANMIDIFKHNYTTHQGTMQNVKLTTSIVSFFTVDNMLKTSTVDLSFSVE